MIIHARSLVGLLLWFSSIHTFSNFYLLEEFVKAHPEFPKEDSLAWENSNYSSIYRQRAPSWCGALQAWLGIKKYGITMDHVESALKQRLSHFSQTQNHDITIARIDAHSEPTLYVWGDIQSSIHSLYRDLNQLRNEGVIDDHFTIKNNNCFFIFNGNVIGDGPYSLETLATIVSLIEKNPHKAIYLRGNNEYNNNWKDGNIHTQLKITLSHDKGKLKRMTDLITSLFLSLPVALYIVNSTEKKHAIRISYFDRQLTSWIPESLLGSFFDQEQNNPLLFHNLRQLEPNTTEPLIIAIIRGEQWRREQRVRDGLGLLNQDKGATAWAILSCPTASHQKFYNFHYDAFTKIKIKKDLSQSTITLCNRDVLQNTGFNDQESYYIASGAHVEGTIAKSKEDIVLGSCMSLIQGVPAMGTQTQNGMMVRIAKENCKGGINGHLLRIIVENDNYNPSKTREYIHTFLKHNINTMVLPIGSPTLSSYLDLIQQNKILTLFPITGSPTFREKQFENIIHFRRSYADEVNALINHAYTEWSARKFALFYQDDSYGQGPRDAAHTTLQNKKCSIIDIPYSRGTITLKKHAQLIQDSQPDVIAFFSTAQSAIELIRELGINTIVNKKLLCISFCAEASLRTFIEQHNIPMLIGAAVPNPFLSQLPIVQEYREAMTAAGYNFDVFSLEAYITTSLLIEALSTIKPPFSIEKIKISLQQLKNKTIGGLEINYNPLIHTLYHTIYLETGNNNEWISKPCGDTYDSDSDKHRPQSKSNGTKNTPTQSMAS